MSNTGTPVASDVKHPAPSSTLTNVETPVIVKEGVITKQRVDPVITETSLADVDYFYLASESFREARVFHQAKEK